MTINGLIPAIVQDYHTGRVLMLAYVNQESYDFMLKNGDTCFWSRSRQELWHKGKTSGDFQKIKSLAFDCDNDTLLIQVEQLGGGACHTGTYSCFGDNEMGFFHIMEKIMTQIKDRQVNPQDKSYTNYLLTEGTDKICKKIGEEAAEIIIATKNGDKKDLTGEIADLAYHMAVLMYTQGIDIRDINGELAKRHEVKGNLKDKSVNGGY